jgi:hypothetical protein
LFYYVPDFFRGKAMLLAFLEAGRIVAATLLAELLSIHKAPSDTRLGVGCLGGGGRENKQRKQNRRSVSLHLSLQPIRYPPFAGLTSSKLPKV